MGPGFLSDTYIVIAARDNQLPFACKESKEKGYEGFVAFVSKTRLMRHYEETLGAYRIGGQRMAIGSQAAEALINRYFKMK